MPRYFELLFDTPVKQTFTYLGDEKGEAAVGKRAMAPFGRREGTACIVAERESPPAGLETARLKAIRRVVDKEPLFGEDEILLARWIAAYYLCSEGEALFAMLPSGRRAAAAPAFSGDEFEMAGSDR